MTVLVSFTITGCQQILEKSIYAALEELFIRNQRSTDISGTVLNILHYLFSEAYSTKPPDLFVFYYLLQGW